MNTSDIENTMLPQEAAAFLGISMQKLSRLRRNKKVKGTKVGNTNLYVYRLADLRQANLQLDRRGPKPKSRIYRGDADYS